MTANPAQNDGYVEQSWSWCIICRSVLLALESVCAKYMQVIASKWSKISLTLAMTNQKSWKLSFLEYEIVYTLILQSEVSWSFFQTSEQLVLLTESSVHQRLPQARGQVPSAPWQPGAFMISFIPAMAFRPRVLEGPRLGLSGLEVLGCHGEKEAQPGTFRSSTPYLSEPLPTPSHLDSETLSISSYVQRCCQCWYPTAQV